MEDEYTLLLAIIHIIIIVNPYEIVGSEVDIKILTSSEIDCSSSNSCKKL
jgi:hypothetical protein